MRNGGLDSAKVIDENLLNPRRLGVPSANKTAQAVVLPSIKGILRLLWELNTKVTGFNRCWKQNENPRRTSFSIGQIEISALGVALANNVLFALLNYKRLRTDNLWILRDLQEKIRLNQVLTLFHSRIQEQDFHFGMIYANHFESIFCTC